MNVIGQPELNPFLIHITKLIHHHLTYPSQPPQSPPIILLNFDGIVEYWQSSELHMHFFLATMNLCVTNWSVKYCTQTDNQKQKINDEKVEKMERIDIYFNII